MKFKLDHITVELRPEGEGFRLTGGGESLLLYNLRVSDIHETIGENYKMVKQHFEPRTGSLITKSDLEHVCLKIVLFYYYMYNHWRTAYKKEKYRDLTFQRKDFNHPYTDYKIMAYFKNKYPLDYASRCEIMLNLAPEKFREYELQKEQFDAR